MNPDTGHVCTGSVLAELFKEKKIAYVNPFANYVNGLSSHVPVPDKLAHAAQCTLDGREETHVSMTSGGKLSVFGREQRKKKRQHQRESRKHNR